ncbi:hypothetical protein [Antarctobacter jejuensis]|uniref:hypothetical protein n=1 Tax=Antarctobacter jejuensis TaxID=1439938 RepID=UPI003FD0460E
MYRILLTWVAIGPALILVMMPISVIGVPVGIALSATGSGYAALVSLRGKRSSARRIGPALLRRSGLTRARKELPAPDDQRMALADALSAAVEGRAEPEAPPTRATAIARILSRMLTGWKVSDLSELPDDLTMALSQLERLLNADPDEASRLVQQFQRPDLVQGLREEIDRIAADRARYERALAAFRATIRLQATATAPRDLGDALQSLGVPDTDLWHRIVLEHDPADPVQREAALWCVSRPNCDRATVAAYFSRLPENAQLVAAALDGDNAFLQRVKHLISRSNAAYYTMSEIAFKPMPETASRLATELDALAALTNEPRWPDPQSALETLEGRDPRPRRGWDLATGRLTEPPHRADYL